MGVLQERHRVELAAAGAVAASGKRLAAASAAHDVAVAALASVLGGDEHAAEVLGVEVAAVVAARQRVSVAAVRAHVDRLRGRGRAGRRSRGADVSTARTGDGAAVGPGSAVVSAPPAISG
ncbi:hypothetical protein [Dactylosporangium sp. CA-139066]|uniref:hypothetical protein n=1 Tax=Dactylosporangium sp. CA-139066 TaxID=3239930 RepID=UPI003D94889F